MTEVIPPFTPPLARPRTARPIVSDSPKLVVILRSHEQASQVQHQPDLRREFRQRLHVTDSMLSDLKEERPPVSAFFDEFWDTIDFQLLKHNIWLVRRSPQMKYLETDTVQYKDLNKEEYGWRIRFNIDEINMEIQPQAVWHEYRGEDEVVEYLQEKKLLGKGESILSKFDRRIMYIWNARIKNKKGLRFDFSGWYFSNSDRGILGNCIIDDAINDENSEKLTETRSAPSRVKTLMYKLAPDALKVFPSSTDENIPKLIKKASDDFEKIDELVHFGHSVQQYEKEVESIEFVSDDDVELISDSEDNYTSNEGECTVCITDGCGNIISRDPFKSHQHNHYYTGNQVLSRCCETNKNSTPATFTFY